MRLPEISGQRTTAASAEQPEQYAKESRSLANPVISAGIARPERYRPACCGPASPGPDTLADRVEAIKKPGLWSVSFDYLGRTPRDIKPPDAHQLYHVWSV
ncbi:hypothetical protein [Phytoactinopolyspora limicola]|uniref:hypothetical protein n=1 Tax=Phytoactinopolyspora limicola TaxID=2715536 RepID=UPI00140D06AF|nr:hypothetical protein [Phytoactinopolyspora limicola]